jgi:hypothetical protein
MIILGLEWDEISLLLLWLRRERDRESIHPIVKKKLELGLEIILKGVNRTSKYPWFLGENEMKLSNVVIEEREKERV